MYSSLPESLPGCREVGSTSTFEYEQEPFEAHKLKMILQCQDIGFRELSKVGAMKEGSFQQSHGVEFSQTDMCLQNPKI
jgi:hypothetical protein